MSADTSRRDALYRTLYLRREYGQLAARSRQALAEAGDATAESDTAAVAAVASDALELETLRDVVLLPPPDAAAGEPPLSTSREEVQRRCWRGLVYVRHRPSPWYGAVFSFLVHFPERYPFECPALLLECPLRSHPLLMRSTAGSPTSGAAASGRRPATPLHSLGAIVPLLEDVYCSVDPMRVSIMALVLKHLKTFFYPSAWPDWWSGSGGGGNDIPASSGTAKNAPSPAQKLSTPSHPRISRMLARRDVKKYGLLHRGDVVLGRPYVDLLATDVAHQLLTLFRLDVSRAAEAHAGSQVQERQAKRRLAETDDADAAVMRWSEWYGRVLLPQILALP